MAASKIAIDDNMLKQTDIIIKTNYFSNRSKAIQEAVAEKLVRFEKRCLAQECAKRDPKMGQSFAEEGFSVEIMAGILRGRYSLGGFESRRWQ